MTPTSPKPKSFLHHAAIYGLGNVLIYAGSFFLLPVYVRCLTEAEYGTLDVLRRVGEVLTLCLFYNGLRQALYAFHNQAETEQEKREVIGSALSLTGFLFVLGGFGLFALAGPMAHWLRVGQPGLVRFAILVVLVESFSFLLLALAQARVESLFFVIVTIVQFVVRTIFSILFVAVFRWGIEGVLGASLLTSSLLVTCLLTRELRRAKIVIRREILLRLFWFALPFIPGGLGFFLLHSGDRFFLVQSVSAAELGAYALGYKLALIVKLFSRQPLYQVWSAKMYKVANQENAPIVFGTMFTRILGAYLFVGLGLCTLNREALYLLVGNRFHGATDVIAPIVLAYFFLTAADLMDSGFYVTKQTYWKTLVTAISTVITLVLYAILIPGYGIFGAALATLCGFVAHLVVTYRTSQRVFPVQYEWGRVCILFTTAILMWAGSLLLPVSLWLIPVKIVYCFGWLFLIWQLSVVNKEEKAWVTARFETCRSWLVQKIRRQESAQQTIVQLEHSRSR